MEIIKYRGKRKKNGEWVYGYYCKAPITDEDSGLPSSAGLYFLSGDERYLIIRDGVAYTIIPKTLGQYVSILDSYQGDVLYGEEIDEYGIVMSRWYGEIRYNKICGRLMIIDDEENWYELDDFDFEKTIGTIHDKPDLSRIDNEFLSNIVDKGDDKDGDQT